MSPAHDANPTLAEVLSTVGYPGRGCLVARTLDEQLSFGYFPTGRSDASRSRELKVLPNGDIAVKERPAGEAGAPRLQYVALAKRDRYVVLGNGDHVVPLAQDLAAGDSTFKAASAHTYVADQPINTPRIWLSRKIRAGRPTCLAGMARRSGRGDDSTDRITWSLDSIPPGTGALLTTYQGTVDEVLPASEPLNLTIRATSARVLLTQLWDALPDDLRIGAFVVDPDESREAVLLAH